MPSPTQSDAVAALLRNLVDDPAATWSLGSFGAIAEFMRDPGEAISSLEGERIGLVTALGAIALSQRLDLRPLAYETAIGSDWSQAIALCLPEATCAMNGRTVVTELGPDRDAARAEDRHALLFDLGLGLRAVDACIRSNDPAAIAIFRAAVGLPLSDPTNPLAPQLDAVSPHWVFTTRIGRIEVFGSIPKAGDAGPHTHIVPKLLKGGRTHAATTPIPRGWIPCGAIHPAHPCKDLLGRRTTFDAPRFAAFQRLLERWGDPDLVAVKRSHAIRADSGINQRHARNVRRVAEIQAAYLNGSHGL